MGISSQTVRIDKLVVHRMKGRGCSWRIPGAQAMLAILRHEHELRAHGFKYLPMQSVRKHVNRIKYASSQQTYCPVSGSVSLFHGGDQSEPWIQLLKRKINFDISLNAYF